MFDTYQVTYPDPLNNQETAKEHTCYFSDERITLERKQVIPYLNESHCRCEHTRGVSMDLTGVMSALPCCC